MARWLALVREPPPLVALGDCGRRFGETRLTPAMARAGVNVQDARSATASAARRSTPGFERRSVTRALTAA
jgi:hypothetical protein